MIECTEDEARAEARAREFDGDYRIFASDLDPEAVEIARENAFRAGVDRLIHFETADAAAFARQTEGGTIITNPPYGERLGGRGAVEALYRAFGKAWRAAPGWRLYLLSGHTEFERCFGIPAEKKRKLYNGMLKCDLFIYGAR